MTEETFAILLARPPEDDLSAVAGVIAEIRGMDRAAAERCVRRSCGLLVEGLDLEAAKELESKLAAAGAGALRLPDSAVAVAAQARAALLDPGAREALGLGSPAAAESAEERERECRWRLTLRRQGRLPSAPAPSKPRLASGISLVLPPEDPQPPVAVGPKPPEPPPRKAEKEPSSAKPSAAPKPARPEPAKTKCPACASENDPSSDRCSACGVDFMAWHRQRAAAPKPPPRASAETAAKKPVAWNAIVGRSAVAVLALAYVLAVSWRGGTVGPQAVRDKDYGVAFTAPSGWSCDARHSEVHNWGPSMQIPAGPGAVVQVGLVKDRAMGLASLAGEGGSTIRVAAIDGDDEYELANVVKLLGVEAELRPEGALKVDGLGSQRWSAPAGPARADIVLVPGAHREYLIVWHPGEAVPKAAQEAFLASFRVLERPYTPRHLWRFLQNNWYDKEVWGLLVVVVGALFWLMKREPEPLDELLKGDE